MNRKICITLFLLFCGLLTSCAKNIDKKTLNEKTQVGDKTSITSEVDISQSSNEEDDEIKNKENMSAKIGEDISYFIPEGWHILEKVEGELSKVEGDLNKDGINDIAAVIEESSESEDRAPFRALLIAFGNKDNTYTFSIKAESAILRADEGGVWGDPFEGISIDRGSILISFFGGSNCKWYCKYRFRYQDNDWYLIGATIGSIHNCLDEYSEESDYNLLTGDYIKKKADENGVMKETKGNRGKQSLARLEDFIATYGEENFLYEE